MKTKTEKQKIVTKDKAKDKRALKKAFVVILVILAVLCVATLLFGFVSEKLKHQRQERVIESEDDYLHSSFRNYYEENYDADIFSEEEYMLQNREIMFKTSDGQEISLSAIDENLLSVGQKFFVRYFDIVTHGRYEEYPELLPKEYRENPQGFEKYVDRSFPQQRVYDIKVRVLAETADMSGEYTYNGILCAYGIYEVSFKILHNDGAFRRDLAEDSERPVIFELVTLLSGQDAGKTMIKNMYTVESLETSEDNTEQ